MTNQDKFNILTEIVGKLDKDHFTDELIYLNGRIQSYEKLIEPIQKQESNNGITDSNLSDKEVAANQIITIPSPNKKVDIDDTNEISKEEAAAKPDIPFEVTNDTKKSNDIDENSIADDNPTIDSQNSIETTEKTPVEDLTPIAPLDPSEKAELEAAVKPDDKKDMLKTTKKYQAKNGQVGVDYLEELTTIGLSDIVITQILPSNAEGTSLEELGLKFSENKIIGTPEKGKAGEYEFEIEYTLKAQEQSKAASEKPNTLSNRILKLLINPDPRDLWKNLDPPADSPYKKEYFDFDKQEIFDKFKVYGASIRGRSHAHNGTHRDDDFVISKIEEDIYLLVVADGAGSAKFSREGSRLACESCKASLQENEYLKKLKQLKKGDPQISAYAWNIVAPTVQKARDSIVKAAEEKELNAKDFATTLLFSVIVKIENQYCLISYGIGDGIAAILDDKFEPTLLTSPDSGVHAGQTRFLTMNDVLEQDNLKKRITVKFIDQLKNLFLMTDGISDVYFETDKMLEDKSCWDKLLGELSNNVSDIKEADLENTFKEWINFFSKGNHDDRTIIWIN